MAEPFFDGNVLALVKNGIIQDFFADFNNSNLALLAEAKINNYLCR